jgi:glycosyltransferase involved in cell wall biosynthesis
VKHIQRQASLAALQPIRVSTSIIVGWPWTEAAPAMAATLPDGSSWPRITIITPSYNHGHFIEETIRSVLLQGYPDLEYMIFDGGSTDQSVEIIRKYEPWLTFWVSERDDGQSDAINRGFARATGEIIAWLNSDDAYFPGALHQAALALSVNPAASMVYAKSEVRDAQDNLIGMLGRPTSLRSLLETARLGIPQPSVLMRAEAVKKAGLLRADFHYGMDWDYWLRLGLSGEFAFVDEVWSKYRLYETSKTGSGRSKIYNEVSRAYADFFARRDLPLHLDHLRVPSMLTLYIKYAQENYVDGNMQQVRRYLLKALAMNWWRALRTERWWQIAVYTLLGQRVLARVSGAKTLLRHLYTR